MESDGDAGDGAGRDPLADFRTRKKTFVAMDVERRAALPSSAFRGRLPAPSELRSINEELGVDLATALFLRTLADSNAHGTYFRDLRKIEPENLSPELSRPITVSIIASNLFQSGRAWGDHVATWGQWAEDIGFDTEKIDTDPRRSVAGNARLIFEYLARRPSRKRIMVTYGQGTTEMRHLMHRRVHRDPADPMPEELEGVCGWISVCGAFAGASSSRLLQEHRLRRVLTRLRIRVSGRNPVALAESSPNFPLWKKPLPVVPDLLTVSIAGLPYRWQLPSSLKTSYDALARSMPNDGVVTIMESFVYPGLLVPIQGMDHRAEDARLEPMFKRVLASIAESIDRPKPTINAPDSTR